MVAQISLPPRRHQSSRGISRPELAGLARPGLLCQCRAQRRSRRQIPSHDADEDHREDNSSRVLEATWMSLRGGWVLGATQTRGIAMAGRCFFMQA